MPELKILVVDDEQGMLEVCDEVLRGLPHADVVLQCNPKEAARKLTRRWDLLITDVRMPGMNGFELLRIGREHNPALPALILTAFPSVDSAVESMKLGAVDYLIKPFDPDDLLVAVQRTLDGRRPRDRSHSLLDLTEYGSGFGDMIGQSRAMKEVFETILQVAATEVDVLITGETGTGKELVARSIHQNSARRERHFVPVDCGAIPEDLLESEFFGHERGAFTGAHTKSLGLLQFADGGTFFLDELGQLPMKLQGKLLRVLQERRVRRLGGTQEIPVDVRVIAATSLDLQQEVRAGRFRDDLLYRINVAQVHLPPLRHREGDIPLLVDYFVTRFGREMNRPSIRVDETALAALCRYSWPGNIRELHNVLKRAITMSRADTIHPEDFPDAIAGSDDGEADGGTFGYFDLRDQYLATFETAYLERLLRACDGNVSEAAEKARLPRGTLYRLLNRHSLDPTDFRS